MVQALADKIDRQQAHSIEIVDEVFIGSVSDENMVNYLFYILENMPGYEIDSQHIEVEKVGKGVLRDRLTDIWKATTFGFKSEA